MALSDAPVNAAPSSIGKLVVIQVLHKDSDNNVDPEEMEKYIGILEALVIMPNQIIFKLHGCDGESFLYTEDVVEIYIQE